jgi:molybdopterin converting factor small subunit
MAKVKLYAAARAAAGTSELSIDAATLEDLVGALKVSHPALGRVLLQSTYLLNGTSCKELSTSLTSQDQIDVMPRFAGG